MSYVCVCGLNDGANGLARERVCVFTLLNNNDCNVTHSNTGLFRKKCISEPQALTPARHRFDFSSPVAIDLPQNPEQTSCKVNQQHPTTPPAVDTPQVTLLAAVCVWLSLSITRTRCFEPPFTTALKHEGFFKSDCSCCESGDEAEREPPLWVRQETFLQGSVFIPRLDVDSLPGQLSLLYVSRSSRDWRV